jgi:WhiB family redox-sensing transcriptional regulator
MKVGNNAIYAIVDGDEDMSWTSQASCIGTDPEAFFPEDKGYDYTPEVKRICNNCPVKNECLSFAVRYRVQGYWGGTTEQERRRLRRYNLVA